MILHRGREKNYIYLFSLFYFIQLNQIEIYKKKINFYCFKFRSINYLKKNKQINIYSFQNCQSVMNICLYIFIDKSSTI